MFEINDIWTLFAGILVAYLGVMITKRVPSLQKYHIPSAVTGGLIVAIVATFIYVIYDEQFKWNLRFRDLLMLGFFSIVGLSAKLHLLKTGGKPLLILLALSFVLLLIQNSVGIGIANAFDLHPAIGLLSGSVTLMGGHGTGVTYGTQFVELFGIHNALEIAMACATFGLIVGGALGGPLAKRLITQYNIKITGLTPAPVIDKEKEIDSVMTKPITYRSVMTGLLLVVSCICLGSLLHYWISQYTKFVPMFVPALFVGIVLTNLMDFFKADVDTNFLPILSDVSLQLFITMSLMSLKLWELLDVAGPILCILLVQTVVTALFTYYFVFKFMGKNYDASVISSGYIGVSLGATPVGLANMNVVTSRYGHSFAAFLVIPLVGAFFVDILNAIVLQFYIGLPIYP